MSSEPKCMYTLQLTQRELDIIICRLYAGRLRPSNGGRYGEELDDLFEKLRALDRQPSHRQQGHLPRGDVVSK